MPAKGFDRTAAARRRIENDKRARMARLIKLLEIAREQIDAQAPAETILWSLGEAQSMARREANAPVEM